MSNLSNVLDVAIGLVFVFGLLSLVATWVQEIIARQFEWRAKFLVASIKNLLTTDDATNAEILKSVRTFVRTAWKPLQDPNLTNAKAQLEKLPPSSSSKPAETEIGTAVKAADDAIEDLKTEIAKPLSPGSKERQLNDLKTVDTNLHHVQEQIERAPSQLKNLYALVYSHPIIKGLAEPGKQPSYIPSREFAIALIDILMKAGTSEPTAPENLLEGIKKGIEQLQGNDDTRDALLTLVKNAEVSLNDAEKQVAAVRDSIAQWFDESMKRATGWYKRHSQWIALWIGIGVALIFNADTLAMAQALWRDPALRETWSNQAVAYVTNKEESNAQQALEKIAAVNFPIGWPLQADPASPIGFWLLQDDADPKTPVNPQKFPGTLLDGVLKLVGIIFTGFALSQGAPIWFDLLGKLVNMRQTGIKPETGTGNG
jgi:hypothetical protein